MPRTPTPEPLDIEPIKAVIAKLGSLREHERDRARYRIHDHGEEWIAALLAEVERLRSSGNMGEGISEDELQALKVIDDHTHLGHSEFGAFRMDERGNAQADESA